MKNTDDLHIKAEKLREEEKFFEALPIYEEVVLEYIDLKKFDKVVEALQGKVLVYKHLYTRTKEKVYYVLGLKTAQTSLDIAKQYNIKSMIASASFRIGEMARVVKKFSKAVIHFTKTVKVHDKNDGQMGDYVYHLGEAQYWAGQKEEGIENLKKGLKLIENNKDNLDEFIYNVWKSGVLLRLYQIYTNEGKQKLAKHYILEAEKIIKSDKRLVIRKKQLAEEKAKNIK